jgi:hypothetical protein
MPNAIKYNTSAETLALKKGNFWIGTGDVGKGPTSSTGYYNGITPPSGGYTIYLNKETGGPSIYTVNTEAQLTGLTSSIAGQTLRTSGACLNWFATQTDKMIFNIDYPAIVTNGLLLNFDAAFTPSYPTTGTTLYDTSSVGNNGTLANGPTFSSANGGGIVLDGTDDTYSITGISLGTSALTIDCWFKYQTNNLYLPSICAAGDMWSGDGQTGWGFGQRSDGVNKYYFFGMMELGYRYAVDLITMVDGTIYNLVGTRTISGTQQILKGYVNGVLIGSVTNNTIFNLSTSTYYPGYNPTILKPQQYYAGGPNPPPATLYNIKVYIRDLTAPEISQNYEAIGTRYTTLQVQSLVVAGGGGGGSGKGGGGGAGGLLTGTTTSLTTNTNYTITIGGGGAVDTNGSNSVFNLTTSNGGGAGGRIINTTAGTGGCGGGAGGAHSGIGTGYSGGTPFSGQGYKGGGNYNGVTVLTNSGGGGGGGAGMAGYNALETSGATGGDGLYFSEYSTLGGSPSGWFAGGAGGGAPYNTDRGFGGKGGGGQGAQNLPGYGTQNASGGTVNTGGGGGGGSIGGSGGGFYDGKSGGSGIVILRIPDVYTARFSSGVSASVTKSGGYKYYKVTATSTTSETVSFS